MSDNEEARGSNDPVVETDRQRIGRSLRELRQQARDLSRESRRTLSQEHNIRFDDTETSASSASESEASAESDSSTNSRRRRKKKKDKYSMSKLLQNQQGVLKSVVQRVTDPNRNEDLPLRTATNTFSKKRISDAVQKERGTHYKYLMSATQVAKVPKLDKNPPATSKAYRDAMQNLKDMQGSRITGEEQEGIHEYLSTCSRLAYDTKLSTDQFYDLLKSRIDPKSTLYREVTNNYRKGTDLKQLFKELCETYPGGTSYLSALRRYNEFTGANMTASQFISKLKNAAHDLINSTPHTVDKDTEIFNKVVEKTMILLPSLATDIQERYLTAQRGDTRGDLANFTSVVMKYGDKIEQKLKTMPRKTIKLITNQENQLEGSEEEEEPIHRINALKLSSQDIAKLRNKCYKCGSASPLQDPTHLFHHRTLYGLRGCVRNGAQTGNHQHGGAPFSRCE